MPWLIRFVARLLGVRLADGTEAASLRAELRRHKTLDRKLARARKRRGVCA